MSSEVEPSETGQGIRLLAKLEQSGAVTETSLTLPPDLPFDQYEALARMFGQLHRTSAWLLGDLLNYGEKVYGETYTQASEATGLAEQTLMNYASVCGRVPRSRRRKTLPFSVHAEVASLPPAEQEMWLKRAASEKWTRGRIREELAPQRAMAMIAEVEKREERRAILAGDEVSGVAVSLELHVPEANGSHEPQSANADRVEVLPPEVGDVHICQCVRCGRYHRTDVDVMDE